MVAGKRYSSSIGIAADERESQRVLQNALREFFHLLGMFVPRDLIPFLGFLDLGGYEKAMKKTARVLDDALNKWLQEHKRKREGGTQLVNEEQDFMDVMLSMLRESDHASFACMKLWGITLRCFSCLEVGF
ncbi:cytochrome P450 CYP82D47 [Ziziphus jujuba]|uniref:Cytochrome P450 CYP82D47 n=1 Tax=Ziziphus jujuba TaxID=326968 RepID=A0ABM3I4J9_ZIZJJ|nr:cytochrome P450 CYP82D47 [Ziziphus jujuba]